MEALRQAVVAILFAGDFDIAGELFGHEEEGLAVGQHGFIKAVGEEAGLETGGTKQRLESEIQRGPVIETVEFPTRNCGERFLLRSVRGGDLLADFSMMHRIQVS